MANAKWGVEFYYDGSPMYIVLFASRNKDNKHIENFIERRNAFLTHKSPSELMSEFDCFVNQGVYGERSRFYYSVNARDPQKVRLAILHFLIDNPNFNLCSINGKVAALAARKEYASEHKWMFDFDIYDKNLKDEFIRDIKTIAPNVQVTNYPTPNGYAIVTSDRFDTRPLYEKWDEKEVELKRDSLICIEWDTKE